MTSKLFLHKFVDQTKVISFPFSTTLLRSLTEVFNCHYSCCYFILLHRAGVGKQQPAARMQGRCYGGVRVRHPPRTKNHEFARRIYDFQQYNRKTKHLSHRVFCVANIKATVARERHCICLGCKGEVNLRYSWGVSISVHGVQMHLGSTLVRYFSISTHRHTFADFCTNWWQKSILQLKLVARRLGAEPSWSIRIWLSPSLLHLPEQTLSR